MQSEERGKGGEEEMPSPILLLQPWLEQDSSRWRVRGSILGGPEWVKAVGARLDSLTSKH